MSPYSKCKFLASPKIFSDFSNRRGQPTIVLAAPSARDKYYKEFIEDIADFQIEFAHAVLNARGDNVLVIVARSDLNRYVGRVPDDVLLVVDRAMDDIWMRDFTTIGMRQQIMCKYRPNYQKRDTAERIQQRWMDFILSICGKDCDFLPKKTSIILDGGGVVDNHEDMAVVTSRICSDNKQRSKNELRERLGSLLDYDLVVIVPDDGSTTGHADGMMAFIDTHTVALSSTGKFGSLSDRLYERCVDELTNEGGKDLEIIQLKSEYHAKKLWRGFDSASGLHVNCVLTYDNLYVPVFGQDPANEGQSDELDQIVLDQITSHTRRVVVPVPTAHKICRMGGSVRCLSWQCVGPLADALVEYARRENDVSSK